MIPLAFDYEVAESVDHAIELLGQRSGEGVRPTACRERYDECDRALRPALGRYRRS